MISLSELNELRGKILIFWLELSASTIFAGLLSIFIFKYDLFIALEIAKLLLLAIAITLPVFVLNCHLCFQSVVYILKETSKEDSKKVDFYFLMAGASFFTGIFFYLLIAARLFHAFSIKTAITILVILEVYLGTSVLFMINTKTGNRLFQRLYAKKRRATMPKRSQREAAKLTIPRNEAEKKLTAQIEKGSIIKETVIKSEADLEKANDEYVKWTDYNRQLLIQIFNNVSISEEYEYELALGVCGSDPSLDEKVSDFQKDVKKKITKLESFKEQLELFKEKGN